MGLETVIGEPIVIYAIGTVVGVALIWALTRFGWLGTPTETERDE